MCFYLSIDPKKKHEIPQSWETTSSSAFLLLLSHLLLPPFFLSFLPSYKNPKVKSECGRIAARNIGLCLVYHKANQYTPLLVEKYFSHNFLFDRVFYNESTFLFRRAVGTTLVAERCSLRGNRIQRHVNCYRLCAVPFRRPVPWMATP